MNILITGGAGYIGVPLTKALLERNHRVTIIDNFIYGFEPILFLVDNSNFSIIKEDIRNDISNHLAKFDAIYHLAAISGYPACEANPNSAQLINVVATRNLTKKLSKSQKIIYASTTSFYGQSGHIMDEESDIDPVSLYGITKYKAEQIVMEKENSIALRFATIFGVSPKMRVDLLVNDFAYKAVTDRCIVLFEAATKRTFLHISDAIKAYIMALEKFESMKNNIYNVGSDDMNYTKQQIAEAIKKYTDCTIIDSEIEDLDLRNFAISFIKINKMGFKASVSLDAGIQELLKLYSFYRAFSPYKTI